jgi:hypothetical protein
MAASFGLTVLAVFWDMWVKKKAATVTPAS